MVVFSCGMASNHRRHPLPVAFGFHSRRCIQWYSCAPARISASLLGRRVVVAGSREWLSSCQLYASTCPTCITHQLCFSPVLAVPVSVRPPADRFQLRYHRPRRPRHLRRRSLCRRPALRWHLDRLSTASHVSLIDLPVYSSVSVASSRSSVSTLASVAGSNMSSSSSSVSKRSWIRCCSCSSPSGPDIITIEGPDRGGTQLQGEPKLSYEMDGYRASIRFPCIERLWRR